MIQLPEDDDDVNDEECQSSLFSTSEFGWRAARPATSRTRSKLISAASTETHSAAVAATHHDDFIEEQPTD